MKEAINKTIEVLERKIQTEEDSVKKKEFENKLELLKGKKTVLK